MISRLDLHNFKCFEELKLPLQLLTLLSGDCASRNSAWWQMLLVNLARMPAALEFAKIAGHGLNGGSGENVMRCQCV